MRVAIIHSQQPANQYSGGATGVPDSEQAWMRKLALQLIPLLRAAGVDAIGPAPLGASYADNVRWVNAQTGVDVLVSLHSNAMGNACILYGTSAKSRAYAEAFQRELNAANLLPFGDRWEFNERKVAEVADTNPPAVLLEVGQHDRADYAKWLRDGIESGTYARKLAAPILRALGVTTLTLPPKPSTPPTSSAPFQEDIMATTDELRQIIREELRALMSGTIPVSAGTDRAWTTTRDAALAEAAELGKVRLPDGTIKRTDDVLGELAEFLTEVREAGEEEIRKAMGV